MKKEVETATIIPIKGLASGVHTYRFTLEQPFFDRFENQDIRSACIEVAVVLERQGSSLRLDIALQGSLLRPCDRCLGDVTAPIEYHAPMVVKFSAAHQEEEHDEVFILDPAATELDLTQYLYDSVCVTIPLQSLHPLGQCDPVMEKKIAELSINKS